MGIYESGEMYLETILEIQKDIGAVRSVDIVNRLGYAKSSVSESIKSLKGKKLIEVDSDGFITLTERGKKIADGIMERHIILTYYLESIGVSKENAEKDACKMEHILSEETFEVIKNLAVKKS